MSSHLRLGLPKGLFPIGIPLKILKVLLSYSILATWTALTIFGKRYKLCCSSLWSLLYSTLGPNIRLRILFSNTLSLHSYLNVRDHVSHPYYHNWQYYCFINFNFWIFREKSRRQECLDRIITRISCFKSAFYFLLKLNFDLSMNSHHEMQCTQKIHRTRTILGS